MPVDSGAALESAGNVALDAPDDEHPAAANSATESITNRGSCMPRVFAMAR
jgi:hypothetical protein